MCMGACGVGGRGEKEPFRTEFQVIHGAIDARSTSDCLLGEQAVGPRPRWESLSTSRMVCRLWCWPTYSSSGLLRPVEVAKLLARP